MKLLVKLSTYVAILVSLTLLVVPASAGVLFTFDTTTAGTATSFTNTVGSLIATFSGPSGAVCDVSGFGLSLESGNALISDLCVSTGVAPFPLTIAFNHDVFGITMNFAIPNTDTLLLTAMENGASVGTASPSGPTFNNGVFAEGTIGFSGTFNSVSLSTASGDALSLDNVNVQDTAVVTGVPEPAGLTLLGCALLGIVARWRKK